MKSKKRKKEVAVRVEFQLPGMTMRTRGNSMLFHGKGELLLTRRARTNDSRKMTDLTHVVNACFDKNSRSQVGHVAEFDVAKLDSFLQQAYQIVSLKPLPTNY